MSRAFNNNTANFLSGDFGAGATKNLPITLFCWVLRADWTDGNGVDAHVGFAATQGTNTNSVRGGSGNGLDTYIASLVDTSAGSDTATLTFATPAEADNVWVACMVTFGSTTSRDVRALFPRQTSAADTTSRQNDTLRYIYVGKTPAGAAPAGGNIAEVAIWNSALGDSDFDLLVTAAQTGATPKSAIPTNLIAYYSLNSDTGATIPDESGNGGPTLTVNGTVSYAAAHPTISDVSPIRMVWRM